MPRPLARLTATTLLAAAPLMPAGAQTAAPSPRPAGAADTAAGTPAPRRRGISGFLDRVNTTLGAANAALGGAPAGGTAAGEVAPGPGARLVTPAPGGRLRVVSDRLEGTDTMTARFRLDTGLTALPPLAACGARPCAAGPALRLTAVRLPAERVPRAATIPVAVEAENRGRAATAPVDVRVAFGNGQGDGVDVFTLRALRSGERVRVTRPVPTPRFAGANVVTARAEDPGTAPSTSQQSAESPVVQVEDPALQWVRVEASPSVPVGGAVRLSFVIRNAAFAATAPATDVRLALAGFLAGGRRPDEAGYRFRLPAIPPRSTLHAELEAGGLTTGAGTLEVRLEADPDHVHQWAGAGLANGSQFVPIRVVGGR